MPDPALSPESEGDALVRAKYRTLMLSCGLELGSLALNLLAALQANSLTLWANAMRVGLDATACLFALFVIRHITRSKAQNFDYGFGKWENMSALFNAVVMGIGLIFLGARAMHNFHHPEQVSGVTFGLVILFFYSLLNGWMTMRFYRLRQQDASPVMNAQFVLYRNAAAASVVSFFTLIVISLLNSSIPDMIADTIGALVLSGIILYGIMGLLQQSLSALLDETAEESIQMKITRALAESYEEYDQLERVRTRRSGARIFVELFLEFAPTLTAGELIARSQRIKTLVETLVPGSEAWVIPVEKTGR